MTVWTANTTLSSKTRIGKLLMKMKRGRDVMKKTPSNYTVQLKTKMNVNAHKYFREYHNQSNQQVSHFIPQENSFLDKNKSRSFILAVRSALSNIYNVWDTFQHPYKAVHCRRLKIIFMSFGFTVDKAN